MEEQNNPPKHDSPAQSHPPRPSGIMDVHRPRPHAPQAAASAPVETEVKPDAASSPVSAPVETHDSAEPATPPPKAESEHKTPAVIAQHIAEEHKQAEEEHRLLAAKASHKSSRPMLAIVMAVVIALGLTGVVVYAYMQSRDDKSKSGNPTATTQQQSSTPATTADVDSTTSEVDSTLNSVDDAKDMPSSDLTDQTLGL